jgi:5'-nucleotidase/UDP-sugar diphosphatase
MHRQRLPFGERLNARNSEKVRFVVRLLVVVLVAAALQLLIGQAVAGGAPEKRVLTVIHVTDLHGALLSEDTDFGTGRRIGGAAVLAAHIEAERQEAAGDALLVDSGDMMQGSALSNLTEGAATIEVMNSVDFDACAVGNHEFDWGVEVLKERIDEATFPFLCANVFLEESGERPGWALPSTILEKEGLKIGLIGVVTTDTYSLVNPKYIQGLRFDAPEPIVNELARELREDGASLVIVLAHIGGEQEEDGRVVGPIAAFTSGLKGVDAVLGGHSHTVVSGDVSGIPVMISASNGRALGVMRFEVDCSSGDVVLLEQRVSPTFVDEVEPHQGVEAVIESFQKKFAGEMDRVIAVAAGAIGRGRGECPLGNLVSDVMRTRVEAAVAFQNSGGIRASLNEGPITVRELYRILPFQNTIVTMYLTGEQIRQVLELGTSESGVVQTSGIRYSYRPQDEAGSRIKAIALDDGTPVVPEELYLVATNDFMASGGDRYRVFADGKDIKNTQILLRDAVIAWMESLHEAGQKILAPDVGRARLLH